MTNICILGGFGYIGLNLAISLQKQNYKVIIIDYNTDPKYDKYDFIKYNIDIRDKVKLNGICMIYDFSTVIWCIDSFINDSLFYDINISGLTSVINQMNTLKIHNFIYISSNHIYGNSSFSNEETKCKPINTEGKVKLVAEDIIQTLYNYNYYILRVGNVYGTFSDEIINYKDNIINQIHLYKINYIKNITINNNIHDYVNFIDLNNAISKCLYRLNVFLNINHKYIINIGTQNNINEQKLFKLYFNNFNISITYLNSDEYINTVNCSYAKKVLLWIPNCVF